ncbi:MAG: anti-sigma factor [Cyclobacteriaceae bacterium]
MNKQELLSEGYLTAYITGEVSAEESEQIEALIATENDVRAEFLELQKTLELLAFRQAVAPPSSVKQLVMQDEKVIKNANFADNSVKLQTSRFMMAASVTLALISAIAALYFYNQWQSTDYRLAQLTARNIELAENYNLVNQELTNIRQDLAVIISPEFQRIILQGTENAQDAKAVVYWNPTQEELFLNSSNMISLTQDQQYQLWALVDGVPIDAGVFDASSGTFQIMKAIGAADAFAVTIEKAGGAESPTLSTMQVYGEVVG